MMLQLLSVLLSASFTLQGVKAQKIKQTVGTWQAKGCYEDLGDRTLTYKLNLTVANSAEVCTAACASNGYPLAGLENGRECYCDKYMVFGRKTPPNECAMTCPGNVNELCGARYRLVLYQDTAATPPHANQCITWRSIANVVLDATPKAGGTRTRLYLYHEDGSPNPIYYNWYASCPGDINTCPYRDLATSWIEGGVLKGGGGSAESEPPIVGDSPTLKSVSYPLPQVPFTGYCAKPNTYAPYGGFMGYPLLSVSGSTSSWALCPNNTVTDGRVDLIYLPVANHPHYDIAQCQDVWVELARADRGDFV